MPPLTSGSNNRRAKVMKNVSSHLTYMIAEVLIPAEQLDITKFRGYGIGQRDPATMPGRKVGSETERDNRRESAKWSARRKWVQSANSVGVKSNV